MTVATAFAVSWKPFTNSNPKAIPTANAKNTNVQTPGSLIAVDKKMLMARLINLPASSKQQGECYKVVGWVGA